MIKTTKRLVVRWCQWHETTARCLSWQMPANNCLSQCSTNRSVHKVTHRNDKQTSRQRLCIIEAQKQILRQSFIVLISILTMMFEPNCGTQKRAAMRDVIIIWNDYEWGPQGRRVRKTFREMSGTFELLLVLELIQPHCRGKRTCRADHSSAIGYSIKTAEWAC